jgi:hypothetical protein
MRRRDYSLNYPTRRNCGHGSGLNYYSVIFRAVSRLPSNTAKARREVYARARTALAAHTDAKREHNALEWAILAVEKSPKEIPGTRGINRFAGTLDFLFSRCFGFPTLRP